MSKDVKPKIRIGQGKNARRNKIILVVLVAALVAGGAFVAYDYAGETTVQVAVAKVSRGSSGEPSKPP